MGLWAGQRWWLSQGWNCLEEEDEPWRREAVSTGLRHGPEYLRQSRADLATFLTIIFGGESEAGMETMQTLHKMERSNSGVHIYTEPSSSSKANS